MDGRNARKWLLWPAVIAALLTSAAGLLWTTERAALALSADSAGQPAGPAAASPDLESDALQSTGGVEIVAPESGAKLRGLARVQVEWPNPLGYAVFRVDGRFAYATTPPYEMRWDTSTAPDGRHVVTVDGYDSTARYAGSSSISVIVENSIPTPPEGVLLAVRFDERDQLNRRISARGELEALRADEALPEGFAVLSAELRCDLTQSVLDTFYEGTSTLIRNRVRTGSLLIEGTRQPIPEAGRYAIVQVSPNGLSLPESVGGTRPRIGLGEISLSLADYPVLPGDTWQKPMGVVCDLYTRRAVFVQGNHTFEGLRWFRGRECAVITSSYTLAELPLFSRENLQASADASASPSHTVELTQRRGMRGGGRRGGRGARMGGRGGAPGQQRGGRAPAAAAPGRTPGRVAAGALERVRLEELEGTRRTYLQRDTGRILHMEDTILGKIRFQTASAATASAPRAAIQTLELTQRRGERGMGRGMRGGGRMGGARGLRSRGGRAGTAGRAPATAAGRPGAPRAGAQIPPKLNYGFRLTTDLEELD
ncbi:MAG: hypothetical protein JSV79_10740 [Armatimonadota bacterium]|nr:MAG: hypothetical protein JSV79_10740 [Armatimonadota bacterium]